MKKVDFMDMPQCEVMDIKNKPLERLINKINAPVMEAFEYADREITRLTAELAAAKTEWTPITSVEQVEELAAGFYEVRDRNAGDLLAVKMQGGKWHTLFDDASGSERTSENIANSYAYKLIRAFKSITPAIPEKRYMWGGKLGTARELAGMESGSVQQLANDLVAAQDRVAALEALAKGENQS